MVIDDQSLMIVLFFRARITKSDRGLSLQEGLVPLVSFILLVFLFSSWAILSPANIMELQPRFFFTAVGIVFSNITVRNYCLIYNVVRSFTVSNSIARTCIHKDVRVVEHVYW